MPVPPFLQPPLPPGNVSRLPGSGGPGGQRLEDSSWQVPTLRRIRRQQSECCQSLCGRGLLADRDLHPEEQALALTHVQGPVRNPQRCHPWAPPPPCCSLLAVS